MLDYSCLDNTFARFESKVDDLCGKLLQYSVNVTNHELFGYVDSAIGNVIIAVVPDTKVGDMCRVIDVDHNVNILAEVMSINDDKVKLLPFGGIDAISSNCIVKKENDGFNIPVGDFLLAKVVDGFGSVMGDLSKTNYTDIGEQDYIASNYVPIYSFAPNALSRPIIDDQFITGVSAIDMFIPCGKGQRIGIFAEPGVGKTTLMGMILRNAQADVIVVGLIGERGREVREFIDLEVDASLRAKCVLVVSTSDRPPVEQLKCGYVVQTIAEHFRDQGKNVLIFIDSITRFARAGREVGLSSGEPITRGGYPASVFLSFPKLMERAGNNEYGSITAFYTVLAEANNLSGDPIVDEVKSILDGHIILDKKLADSNHFPAIDVLRSLSRIGDRLVAESQVLAMRHLRRLLSKYDEVEFLIRIGEYKSGQDKLADEAVAKKTNIMKLLQQDTSTGINTLNIIQQFIALSQER